MRNSSAEDKPQTCPTTIPPRRGDLWSPVSIWATMIFTLILTISSSATAGASIRKIPEGKTAPAAAFIQDGTTWISIIDFAAQAGFKHTSSLSGGKMTFTNDRGRISFFQDNQFYTVDTTVLILPHQPIFKESTLYLPALDIIKAFGGKYSGMLSWDAKTSTLIVNTLKHNVLTISSDVKQNGTVISIVLADSLHYEYTYFHPNLVVNFHNANIDPRAIRRSLRSGLIDSAFTLQYDGSAQVSFILNRNIETPHIDYNRANRTLMLALRPRIEQQRAAAPASSRQQVSVDASLIRTIVLDPGHGGRDPGAVGPTGVLEKNVTLAIALELKKMLEKAGLKVYMTRDKDVFIPLRDRTKFANDKKADLFVSIHANAVAGDKRRRDAVKGYKIYFLSQAKNESDRLSAMRENAVIELEDKENRHNYDALQDVLISIAGTEHLRESQDLSIIMEQTLAATQKKIPRSQLGVGQANFWVLNGAYMPAVLVESGFISNTEEEKLLSDKRIQFQLATALSEAIIKFKKLFEGL